jgi:hypothetical protein
MFNAVYVKELTQHALLQVMRFGSTGLSSSEFCGKDRSRCYGRPDPETPTRIGAGEVMPRVPPSTSTQRRFRQFADFKSERGIAYWLAYAGSADR